MSEPVIRVENVSKRYVIGHQRSKDDGLRHTIEDAVRAPLKWLFGRRERKKQQSEEFWALKDVSFDVKQGEVLGVIGSNGAGKSTLLKILSRITEPTTGRIQIDGRIASLLEVGTGFHPELTGRENIFLNGAILGMSKIEITKKFDEIVAFSEIEKFLDTPVKRYSSGMYVRLAFAVAAHLEPEILIVDEVLAVGDVQFQKKCLGKMGEISKEHGRSVVFVSHNMAATQQLTQTCVLLDKGRIRAHGPTADVISTYLETAEIPASGIYNLTNVRRPGAYERQVEFVRLEFSNLRNNLIPFGTPIELLLTLRGNEDVNGFRFGITIFRMNGTPIGNAFSPEKLSIRKDAIFTYKLALANGNLAPGKYYCGLSIGKGTHETGLRDFDVVLEVLHFEVAPVSGPSGTLGIWNEGWGCICFPVPEVSLVS
jgi:lipopolysaccharide transport system ATP-binding protein